MAIKIDCPRCEARLQMPNKLAGGYAHCPQCKGRLWVGKDAPADETRVDGISILPGDRAPAASAAVAAPAAPPPVGPPIRGLPQTKAPPAVPLAAPPIAASAPSAPTAKAAEPRSTPRKPKVASAIAKVAPVPPPAPPARKKVAHFITAEAADSTLRLAADGKLPELHLEEVAGKKAEAKSKSMNPLVVAAALSVSVTLSAVLLLVGTGQPSAAGSQQKALMRQKIEANYFSADENKELEAYQVLLRDAQRAFTRGDYRSERQDYRRVLDMLRAERGSQEKGLTGSRTRDHELEDAISVLLSGG